MPPNPCHLRQPLAFGCFSALKGFYGKEIEKLMRNHVTKSYFCLAFPGYILGCIHPKTYEIFNKEGLFYSIQERSSTGFRVLYADTHRPVFSPVRLFGL